MGTVAVCLSMHLLRTCLKPDVAVLQLVWVAGEAANMFEYVVQPVLSLQHTIFHPGPVKLSPAYKSWLGFLFTHVFIP